MREFLKVLDRVDGAGSGDLAADAAGQRVAVAAGSMGTPGTSAATKGARV
jgi:hypothetical protein